MHRAILVLLLAIPNVGYTASTKSPWLEDLEAGRRLAKVSGKPLFVVFRCEH